MVLLTATDYFSPSDWVHHYDFRWQHHSLQGFSAQYGLFAANAQQQLYPNPAALNVVEEGVRLIEFLGRMLGKALYEGILLELPLAGMSMPTCRVHSSAALYIHLCTTNAAVVNHGA